VLLPVSPADALPTHRGGYRIGCSTFDSINQMDERKRERERESKMENNYGCWG